MVDEKTRTLVVRCEIANPQRKLKPEMFVTVAFTTSRVASALVVPDEAVQTEAGKAFVFVAATSLKGEGRFERREVSVGKETDGFYEVLSGLKAGEKVVTEGAFLVKSESKKGELGGHEH